MIIHKTGLISQSSYPRLWLIFQYLVGGTKDKQKLAVYAYRGENRILEIGCSVGNVSDVFVKYPGILFTGIDIDSTVIAIARKRFAGRYNFQFLETSAEQYSHQNHKFDYILIAGMLHHVNEQTAQAILQAAKRLASSNATIIVYEPDCVHANDSFIMKMFIKLEKGQYLRKPKELKQLILSSGLRVKYEKKVPIRPGVPWMPIVARFSYFIAE